MKRLFFLVVLLQVVFLASGQNLSVYLNDGPRGTVHKIDGEDAYRMAFRISGLNDDASVKKFIDNCKAIPGVIDVMVKEVPQSGQRSVLMKMNEKKDEQFFKTMMNKTGITRIYYNEKEYSTDQLEMLQKDRAANNTQNPSSKKSNK